MTRLERDNAQSIHAHAAKEEAFWREIRERTSAGAMRRTG